MADRSPKGTAVARELRTAIARGKYRRTPLLPSQSELADTYKVSRGTIREALQILENEGLIQSKQGSGTTLTTRAMRMSTRSEPIDAASNFQSWKLRNRVPDHFPELEPLGWDDLSLQDKLYYHHAQIQKVKKIQSAASSPAPQHKRVAVFVQPGHGCTTLFNHVYKEFTTEDDAVESTRSAMSVATRCVPVRVTWHRMGTDPAQFTRNLDAIIREDLIRELVKPRWSEMTDDTVYGVLIGAIRDGDDDPDIEAHRVKLETELSQESHVLNPEPPDLLRLNSLKESVPLLAFPTIELLEELQEATVTLILMFDLSPNGCFAEGAIPPLAALVGTIKDIHDDLPVGIMKEMFFVDHQNYEHMRGIFNREMELIEFPHFTAGDFFGVLARHYPTQFIVEAKGDRTHNRVTMELAAVIGSDYMSFMKRELELSGRDFKDVGLIGLAKLMKSSILEVMDAPWEDIPFHLVPPVRI